MPECRSVDAIDMDRTGAPGCRAKRPEKAMGGHIQDRTDHEVDGDYSSRIDRKTARDHPTTA